MVSTLGREVQGKASWGAGIGFLRDFSQGWAWDGEADGVEIYLEVNSTGLAKGLIPGKALRQRGAVRVSPRRLF